MRYYTPGTPKSKFLNFEPYTKQIDLAYIESVCLGDTKMMIRLIESFMKNMDEFTLNTRLAVVENNLHDIYESCHKIKATVNSFGLNRLKVPMSRLEQLVLCSAELDSVEVLVNKCIRLFESAKLELCSKLEALQQDLSAEDFTR